MADNHTNGVTLRIHGKVQGVGFRPYVWQLANRLQLCGDVSNDGSGVLIHLAGKPDAFLAALHENCPPLARIERVEQEPFRWRSVPHSFTIGESSKGKMETQITPDAGTCLACLRELYDPADRRYRYPFINCTHCGPRYTIIRAMPYDRALTVMKDFTLCPSCHQEYLDPMDRRFHAQPVACPACGPAIFWQCGEQREAGEDALKQAVSALRSGAIVAVKGLGGFHLAVDAGNHAAVQRLRRRKQRPTKPFAVMVPDTHELPAAALPLLSSPAAPIVLMDAGTLTGLSDDIMPGRNEIGIMLPATPLQHLLMQDFGGPLVMTSGNLNGCPPVIDNSGALTELAGIADGWLLHNRDILQRMDDSVVRISGEILRRARGFVPDALLLPDGFQDLPPILALGSEMKNTFCLVRGRQAVMSQYFGDLAQEGVEAQWQRSLDLVCSLYDFVPERIVTDAHPGWRSTQLGRAMAPSLIATGHHHAHAAACLGEHHWPLAGGRVIALALDGAGYGQDGHIWGGECLRVDYRECERLGGLPAVALPGGDMAARHPWRNLLAHCEAFVPDWQNYRETEVIRHHDWQPLAKAARQGINAPLASSCGRFFDAIAAALDCTPENQSYEGEAACRLEALAMQHNGCDHPVTLPLKKDGPDLASFWRQWLDWQATPGERAWAFHDALAKGLADLARHHAIVHNIPVIVCCGGVMQNRLMRARLAFYLSEFQVYLPEQLPAGDDALSYGQALIAAAHFLA